MFIKFVRSSIRFVDSCLSGVIDLILFDMLVGARLIGLRARSAVFSFSVQFPRPVLVKCACPSQSNGRYRMRDAHAAVRQVHKVTVVFYPLFATFRLLDLFSRVDLITRCLLEGRKSTDPHSLIFRRLRPSLAEWALHVAGRLSRCPAFPRDGFL